MVAKRFKSKQIYVDETEWIRFVAKYKSASEKLREFIHQDLEED